MTGEHAAWLHRLNDRPRPAVRLFCFPSVGAGPNMFADLSGRIDGRIEMWGAALPGREARFSEPPPTDLDEVVWTLTQALLPHTERPYALFGYCSGALLAYLVARRLTELGVPAPLRLIVANYPPPHVENRTARDVGALGSEDFWRRIIQLDGVPEQITQMEDLRDVFEPVFRADYRLIAQYEHRDTLPIGLPVTLLSGGLDPLSDQDVTGWARHSDGGVHHEIIPGSRWFVLDAVDELSRRLDRLLTAAHPGVLTFREVPGPRPPSPGSPRDVVFLHDGSLALSGALNALESARNLYSVTAVRTPADVHHHLAARPGETGVLIVGLPPVVNSEFLSHVRAWTRSALVLAIARTADFAQLTTLTEAGVNGYMDMDMEPEALFAALTLLSRGRFLLSGSTESGLLRRVAEAERPRYPSPPAMLGELTEREGQVLGLVADGWTHKQISTRLGLSKATVDTYVQRIRQKLGLHNKAELTRAAVEYGLSPAVQPATD
ncbi:thioesterase domain-containing protein [Actinomadura fibrosa]|uniref:Thioesterase domain-containing protein n=2 Tax=Actinomadura fibrosa TaxID=111802 RepID=A0ABW2XJ68_9ACTN